MCIEEENRSVFMFVYEAEMSIDTSDKQNSG